MKEIKSKQIKDKVRDLEKRDAELKEVEENGFFERTIVLMRKILEEERHKLALASEQETAIFKSNYSFFYFYFKQISYRPIEDEEIASIALFSLEPTYSLTDYDTRQDDGTYQAIFDAYPIAMKANNIMDGADLAAECYNAENLYMTYLKSRESSLEIEGNEGRELKK